MSDDKTRTMIQKLSYCYKNNKFIIIKGLLAKFSKYRRI